jgi:hypothetical protein
MGGGVLFVLCTSLVQIGFSDYHLFYCNYVLRLRSDTCFLQQPEKSTAVIRSDKLQKHTGYL